MWDGRVFVSRDQLTIGAYSPQCEQVVGYVDERGVRFNPEIADSAVPLFKLTQLRYNPFTGQLWQRQPGGRIERQLDFFLPPPLIDARGRRLEPALEISRSGNGKFELVARFSSRAETLASCTVSATNVIRESRGFSPELGKECTMITSEPTTVLEVQGELSSKLHATAGPTLVFRDDVDPTHPPATNVVIDGRFDEWRSVPGIADPQGDIPGYLDYNPDTDLLEFKVANDAENLYLYSRVVGRHGHTAAGRDRYYFYVYIDADRDPDTGYIPTRDDDCYFGVAIGDDCEAQYEFVGGRFVKTFYGFTGGGGEEDVLAGKVELARSWYSRNDPQGQPRERYKVEYIRRDGRQSITEDFMEGSSDEITIAISPDGSECEMRASLAGFLENAAGKPIIAVGQRIDLAVGVESSGEVHGNTHWGADSTAPLRGYLIKE